MCNHSDMDVHARIQAFLQQKTIVSLVFDTILRHDDPYTKAGVVPFIRKDAMLYYVMKPVAKRPDSPEPTFQICKGTRMALKQDGSWTDMKEGKQYGQCETLVITALREGIEELGLKLDAITCVMDVGPYRFSSEKTGKSKRMWLFALELPSVEEVLPASEVDRTTDERAWLNLDEFAIVGRADHRYILRDIAAKLQAHYKE